MDTAYQRLVDRAMHDYGETDFDKKRIRVNPRKGDLINTIIHEELHVKYPDKSEKWIREKSKKKETTLTMADAVKLLKKYKNKPKGKKNGRR